MNKTISHIAEMVLSLLYPPRCPFCSRIIKKDLYVCPECAETIPYIRPPVCSKCGRPVLKGDSLCDDCLEKRRFFEAGSGLLLYQDKAQEALYALKYKGRRDIGKNLGALLFENKGRFVREWQADLVVPVPVHAARRRQRGYNQAEVIANDFADRAGLKVESRAVQRNRKTEALKELSREDRARTMAEAFGAGEGAQAVRGRRVLVIDDIYTSGATIDAVSRVLLKEGASAVAFLAVCIGSPFMVKYDNKGESGLSAPIRKRYGIRRQTENDDPPGKV